MTNPASQPASTPPKTMIGNMPAFMRLPPSLPCSSPTSRPLIALRVAHSKLSNTCLAPAATTSNAMSYSSPQTSQVPIGPSCFEWDAGEAKMAEQPGADLAEALHRGCRHGKGRIVKPRDLQEGPQLGGPISEALHLVSYEQRG